MQSKIQCNTTACTTPSESSSGTHKNGGTHFHSAHEKCRLFSLQYGPHDAEPDSGNTDNLCCVKVNIGLNSDVNDLVSSLAAELAPDISKSPNSKRQVIFEAPDVISFHLVRDAVPPAYDAAVGRRAERATFKYPKSVYLDQFMKESFELANERRSTQRELLQDAKELETKKKNLLHFKVSAARSSTARADRELAPIG